MQSIIFYTFVIDILSPFIKPRSEMQLIRAFSLSRIRLVVRFPPDMWRSWRPYGDMALPPTLGFPVACRICMCSES